jgi:hypothetical protein
MAQGLTARGAAADEPKHHAIVCALAAGQERLYSRARLGGLLDLFCKLI